MSRKSSLLVILCHISRSRIYHFETDGIYRTQHIAFFLIGESNLSFLPELEVLRIQKVNLVDELQFIGEEEKALKEKLKMLEEELAVQAVQELARPPFQVKPLEWSASPETVRSLYSG